MNLMLGFVFSISCLTQLLVALKIDSFIPQYCQGSRSPSVNNVTLSRTDDNSVLVLTAYLWEGLNLTTKDNSPYECRLVVRVPPGTGIVTTVKTISFHDNDTLTFSGSNSPEEHIWGRHDENYRYKEIVAKPIKDEFSHILVKFTPGVKTVQHNAGFELSFTAFTPKVDSCKDDEFDCGNERCITSDVQCNGYNNCGDSEADESGCGVSLWVIILLIAIGILVVVLAVFVWYRMAQR